MIVEGRGMSFEEHASAGADDESLVRGNHEKGGDYGRD